MNCFSEKMENKCGFCISGLCRYPKKGFCQFTSEEQAVLKGELVSDFFAEPGWPDDKLAEIYEKEKKR